MASSLTAQIGGKIRAIARAIRWWWDQGSCTAERGRRQVAGEASTISWVAVTSMKRGDRAVADPEDSLNPFSSGARRWW